MREVLKATGGRLLKGSPEICKGISTDTRTLRRGELFVALHGDRFDGHHYISQAVARGAAGVVVDCKGAWPHGANIVRVKDTLRALGDLAQYWRKKFPIPVVGVTGSNGKTTTKEMIAALLATRYRVLKTRGNFNNLIGLPLTIFGLSRRTEIAVLEMGMNHPGEIARLAEIAAPEVGVITNIGRAHLAGLGSLARVARAKGELLERLEPGGVAVLNGDDSFFPRLAKIAQGPVVRFGSRGTIRARGIRVEGLKGITFTASVRGKKGKFHLPASGFANVSNALAAIAVADHFGIPVSKMPSALHRFHGEHQRMEVVRLSHGIDLINDSYNANPDSMKEALNYLRLAAGARRKIAVLGEMLELGASAPAAHRELGKNAAAARPALIFYAGRHGGQVARGARTGGMKGRVFLFPTATEIASRIRSFLKKGDLLLVKGSRGTKMEQVIDAL